MCRTVISLMTVLLITFQATFILGDKAEASKDKDGSLDDMLTNEEVEACRKESNYYGNFSDTTHEMKCFVACGMVKLGVMNAKDGTLDVKGIDELLAEEPDDKEEVDKFRSDVVQPCIKEVTVGTDYCENAFNYVICAVRKTMAISFRR